MMKYISILGLLVSLTFCHSHKQRIEQKAEQKISRFAYYQNDTIRQLLKRVVRTDLTKTTCFLSFRSFDKNELLVAQSKYDQCQSNSKSKYLTRSIYNQKGKLILEETFNMEGMLLERKHY